MNSRAGQGARYLYAISRPGQLPGRMPAGIGGTPVYALAEGDIAAVVSDTALTRIRPERRHLSAHHEVIRSLMKADTMLPVAFGMIASSQAALLRMLQKHRNALGAELDRLAGQAELDVRLAWDVPNIFEHMVKACPDLKAMRDQLAALGEKATRDDKIELGSMFERVLSEERERHTAGVEAVLGACCSEIRRSQPRREAEVTRLACLVPRNALEAFERQVAVLSRRLDDSFLLSYNGPWPPHHFVNLNISV